MSLPPDSDPYTAWRHAVAEADRVFASPPALDRPVDGCTYCTPESELHILGGEPAAVPDDLLGHFLREVPSHWEADQYPVLWRRLMPRALRYWGPDGHGADPSEELGHLGRLGAGFADWPAPERAAAEQAFRALLAIALVDGRPPSDLTQLVEGIAHATEGVEPWLAHLAGLSGPAADAGLVRLALDWATELLWEEFEFTWWHEGDPQVVAAWLPTQRPRIAAFARRHPRCKTAADALIAVDRLRAGGHSPWLYPYGMNELLGLVP
ncbi:hypothetical protein AN217_01925 [Streptomyces qinglanensis]|uniref:Uncharacterized protein n=1 Tax=Streptomyces qinglanensis TaxID=943816 RepID=A0A1E7KDP9_9ACTN|nr:hypothetical protein [Streptomyces qinglanensis]OEV02053.1 hypothetical protein AN217_01925 [Streptomyces qinglanensis]OEV24066.1 hypothetical protein AN220_21015 [Streptomyces nanshensis]